MCGICGVIQVDGRPRPLLSEARLGPNDRRDDASRAERPWSLPRRRRRPWSPPAEHRRRRGRPPTVAERDAATSGRSRTASCTTTSTCGVSSSATVTCSATAATPRCCLTSTSASATRFPAQLRGMFGIAVWDERARRAVLARDRLGIKPLYYAQRDDVLVFASELKCLLASGLVDPALDYEAIDAFLTLGYLPGPRTPLDGVSKLMPGHVLVVEDRDVRDRALLAVPGASGLAEAQRRGVPAPAARQARRVRQAAPDERRAAGRDAQRRARLECDRRPDGPAHDRAREDILGRLCRGRARRTSWRTRGEWRSSSAPSTTSSSCRSRRTRSTSKSSSGTSTSRSQTSRRSDSWLFASSPRATSPSRCPDRAPTSFSAATRATAQRRSPAPGDASRTRQAIAERLASVGPRRVRRAMSTLAAESTVDRFLTMALGTEWIPICEQSS